MSWTMFLIRWRNKWTLFLTIKFFPGVRLRLRAVVVMFVLRVVVVVLVAVPRMVPTIRGPGQVLCLIHLLPLPLLFVGRSSSPWSLHAKVERPTGGDKVISIYSNEAHDKTCTMYVLS